MDPLVECMAASFAKCRESLGEGWVSLSSVKVDKQGRASPAEGTPGKGLGMGEAKYGQPRLQALAQGCG